MKQRFQQGIYLFEASFVHPPIQLTAALYRFTANPVQLIERLFKAWNYCPNLDSEIGQNSKKPAL